MTENTFTAPAEEQSASNRKTLFIAGGAAGALVLAGGGFLLLHGGSSSDDAFGPVPHKARPAVTTAKAPVRQSVKPSKLPAASAVKIGRDPFAALYIVPAAGTAPAGTGTTPTTGGTTPTTPTTGGTTPTTTTSGTGGSTTPTKPTTPVATHYTLKLLSVSGFGSSQTAAFSVAGKKQYARVGSVFGRTSEIKLLSFQQISKGVWSVTIQVGDDDPKDLAIGEAISVM